MKVPARLVSGEASLLGLQMAFLVSLPLIRAHPLTSFNFNYLFIKALFPNSHFIYYWGLTFQHQIFGERTIQLMVNDMR